MDHVRIIIENFFKKFGCSVARHPCVFTLCPLMLSFLLTTGIQKANVIRDIEYLYAPSTSISVKNRLYLEVLFPVNLTSNFYPERYTREGSFGSVIIVANDGDSILRPHIFKEAFLLDQTIRSIIVPWDNRQWSYRHMCARRHNVCFRNIIFNFQNVIVPKHRHHKHGNFECTFDSSLFNTDNFIFESINGENESTYGKAARMDYYLDDSTENRKHLADQWEKEFAAKLKSLKFHNISIDVLTSRSLEDISWKIFQRTILYIFIVLCSLAFCWLIFASEPNSLPGKPWMGVVIVISSGLAVSSGHGLLMYCELYFIPSTVTATIVILGTTTVDSLVMLSLWRETDREKSVEDRLGQAYSESGIPITASFLINFLSLLIGTTFSPFREFSIFCFYMASCLALGFIYQMTLIGGCLAAFGYAEKKHLNSLTFRQVQITAKKENHLSLCSCSGRKTGDSIPNERTIPNSSSKNFINELGKKFTAHVQTKSFLIVLYLVYLASSIWGIAEMKNDYAIKETFSQDTYVNSYFQRLRNNFSQYRDKIQIVLNTTLNYADRNVQEKINYMLDTFESVEYGEFYAKSWLRNYLKFLSNKKVSLVLQNYNMTNEDDFLHVLHHHFLRYPFGQEFVNDLVFDEEKNSIIASRFLLQSTSFMTEESYWKALQKLRQTANEEFFPSIVFHPDNFIYEGVDISLPTVLIELGIKAVITAIVSLVILTRIIHTVTACFSYLSVCVGVLGYMAFWDVGMSPVSSKYLVCFSTLTLNYLTHSAYAYSATSRKKNDTLCWKIKLVLLKGSIVSTLSVITVFIRPYWIFHPAFKAAFLTSIFAALQTICFQEIANSLYDSFKKSVKLSTATCSRKRDCRTPGKFRHPAVGGIYNGSVVISHIDLCT